MKNFLLCCLLLVVSTFVFGQANIAFINSEVQDVDGYLVKKGDHNQLSNQQKVTLHKIFEEKFQRVEQVLAKKLSKLETSVAISKIDDEFLPQVHAVLDLEQRMAYQKKRKPTYSNSSK